MLNTYHVCAKTVLNEDAATTVAAVRALYFILESRNLMKRQVLSEQKGD